VLIEESAACLRWVSASPVSFAKKKLCTKTVMTQDVYARLREV
jgi:hypothetical protein